MWNNAMRFNAMRFNAMRFNAMRFNAMRNNAARHYSAGEQRLITDESERSVGMKDYQTCLLIVASYPHNLKF